MEVSLAKIDEYVWQFQQEAPPGQLVETTGDASASIKA
jgi:hypothetical protein